MMMYISVLAMLTFLHLMFIFAFTDKALERATFGYFGKIISSLFYSYLIVSIGLHSQSFSMFDNFMIAVFFLITFLINYRANIYLIGACALAVALHVLAFRSIMVFSVSLITGQSLSFLSQPINEMGIMIMVTVLLIVATGVLNAFLSKDAIEVISKKPEQLKFLIVLYGIFVLYVVVNSGLNHSDNALAAFSISQISAAAVMMVGMYTGLFFLINTNRMQDYIEQSEMLQNEVSRAQLFNNLITSGTLATYEFDCTLDELISMSYNGSEVSLPEDKTFSATIERVTASVMHPEDYKKMGHILSVEHILNEHQAGRNHLEINYRRLTQLNEYRWVNVSVKGLLDKRNHLMVTIIVSDVHEDEIERLELQEKAQRDSLTGAYNKGAIKEKIDECLALNTSGTLAILDLDDFKMVNDNLGHECGDFVLVEIVNKITELFRDDDLVGRIGGDEFIVFINADANITAIHRRMNNLLQAIKKSSVLGELCQNRVSCSIGVAIAHKHGESFDELYRNADFALYESKRKGKNTYSIYQNNRVEGFQPIITEIDSNNKPTSMQLNPIYEALSHFPDKKVALQNAMQVLIDQFRFDHGYLYHFNAVEGVLNRDIEVFNSSVKNKHNSFSLEVFTMPMIPQELVDQDVEQQNFYFKNREKLMKSVYIGLIDETMQSLYVRPILDNKNFTGFISLDKYRMGNLSDDEVVVLNEAVSVIMLFYKEMIKSSVATIYQNIIDGMLMHIQSNVCVVNKEGKLIYVSPQTRSELGVGNQQDFYQFLSLNQQELLSLLNSNHEAINEISWFESQMAYLIDLNYWI